MLLIVGASTRSAAHSAVRAGIKPVCADLFLDEDLRAVADVCRVSKFPHSLPVDTATAPSGPWLYTGALENHPEIVSEISAKRQLLGNTAESLRRVRNPFNVREILLDSNLPALSIREQNDPPPASGDWLLKPIRGANGSGIRVWTAAAARIADLTDRYYFQVKRAGTPISALYLATASTTWLIGIARQMIGNPSLHAPAFGFCGALVPVNMNDQITAVVEHTGNVLARACDL